MLSPVIPSILLKANVMQDIFGNHDLLKAIPSVFAFSSIPELVAGFYLLYYFRVFERQIGSNKYSVSSDCPPFSVTLVSSMLYSAVAFQLEYVTIYSLKEMR